MRNHRWLASLCIIVLGLVSVRSAAAQSSAPDQPLPALVQQIKAGQAAAERGDLAAAKAAYGEIHERWEQVEDRVRAKDPAGYAEIEAMLGAVGRAVSASPANAGDVERAYDHLLDEAQEHLLGAPHPAEALQAATPAEVLDALDSATTAALRGDSAAAAASLDRAIQAWPSIEGSVAASSADAYTAIETDLGRASAALKAQPADLSAAADTLKRVSATLAPFARPQTYSLFDAAAVILREGLEALLVVVALLAFLRRSGNQHRSRWIWGGAAVGVLASIATAFALQALFSRVSAGQNRELIEGITGLAAAGLLFYVSYWLHSNASLHAWQRYIDAQTSRALASGSMLGLAALSFLAVFREGAETTIFYLGMAPAIATRDLLLGVGLGLLALVLVAVLMLVVGVRLPLRLFFRVAALLVYYLGFKFVGLGIHALQVSDVLPTSPIPVLPPIAFLGVYPTWESLVPQVLLIVAAGAAFVYLRALDRRVAAPVSNAAA